MSSELLAHYKSLSIHFRGDINVLLTQLSREKNSKCVVSRRREAAEYCVRKLNINVNDWGSGTKYVPIDLVMRYIKNQSSFTSLLNV